MGNKPRNRTRTAKQGTAKAAKQAKQAKQAKAANRTVAQARQERPKTPWLRYLLIGGGSVAAVVLLVLTFGGLESKPDPPPGIQTFTGLGRDHVEAGAVYEQDPPVGGNHASTWLNCGFYDTPVPNENAVHSLEHGAVWITFQPDLAEDQIGTLRDLAKGTKVLVSPYPGLEAPVVASTWGAQLSFTGADDPLLKDFVLTMKNATAPESNASCDGGIGNPA